MLCSFLFVRVFCLGDDSHHDATEHDREVYSHYRHSARISFEKVFHLVFLSSGDECQRDGIERHEGNHGHQDRKAHVLYEFFDVFFHLVSLSSPVL